MAGSNPTPKRQSRLLWLGTGVLILGTAFAWLTMRSRNEPAKQDSTKSDVPALSLPDTNALANSLPAQGGPLGYAGSETCKECHTKQFETWWRSHHRQMTQVMSTNTVQAKFEGVVMYSGGARFTLHQSANRFWVDIQGVEELEAARLTNGTPTSIRLPMEMVTGSHYFQVFWLPTGHGNRQIGFPFTWLVAEKRWVFRNDAFIRDPDLEPRPEQWNTICIRCHATGARPMPVPEQKRFDTHVTELGIACEACHGPGEAHAALERRHQHDAPATRRSHSEIVQPAHLDRVRSSQVCGFCHGMKWFEDSSNWKQLGFTYRPGDDLEKTTPIMRPTHVADQPWLTTVLTNHPDIFEDFFWPDGMVRVTGREFNGLLESACYQKGELACVSCHSMHKSDPDKQLKDEMNGNQACFSCHKDYQTKLAEHTHHAPESSGSLCYNCHMPYTAYGLLRAVRSHQIDRPTVMSNLKAGRPNACNLCHLDKSLGWAAQHLSDWYGQPVPEMPEEEKRISSAVRLLLSGDTGQRALAAFSLGWEPALEASGRDWEAPLLASTLEDRYAAIRFISYRSLTHLPGFAAFPFDFESSPEERQAARERALDLWRAGAAALGQHEATLTGPGPRIDTNTFSRLLKQRDDRPVHLRE